jgi:hypothetical protein
MADELDRVPVEVWSDCFERETLHIVHERVDSLGFRGEFTSVADGHCSSNWEVGVRY